jgi:hypothetical protein
MAVRYRHGRLAPTLAANDRLARIGDTSSAEYRRAMSACLEGRGYVVK